jgi:rhamnose transport system substrate-binding protein
MSKRLIGLLLVLALSACEKRENAPATNAAGSGGGASSSGKAIKMVYIAKNTGNPYFDSFIEGFKEAAAKDGVEATVDAPETADPASQIPKIKAQLQRGVNVIAISPNSTDALNQVLADAMAKGVTVVTVDSDLTGNEQYRNAAVKTADPEIVGRSQIELMGSLIGYKGKFAILSSTTVAPNQNEWIEWMKKALTDPKYKEMQLVEIVYGNDEPQKSYTEAEALLTKYPDLRGIIAPTTVGIAAAAQVVETAKKADQVQVTGLGTPNQMRKFIQNGTVKAFALWSPKEEGYLSGHLSYLLASKQLMPAVGTSFNVPTMGERKFIEKNVVITGPPVTFTKENIEQFHF